MSVLVRSYNSSDDEELVNFLVEVFNGWPKFDLPCSPLDYWRWKYRDNPLNIMIIGLATHNGKIIGCRHDLIQTLKIGKDLFLSTSGLDIAVHKDFRGIRLSSKMRAHDVEIEKAKGIKLHYGIDTHPILLKKVKRSNYPFPFSLEGMVRIRDVDLQLKMYPPKNAFLKKYGYYAIRSINKLTTLGENIDEPQENIKILEIQKFDERIEPFLNLIKQHFEFMVARDKVYLNWRYCDPRGGKYLIKIAVVQDRILGYIVLRINKLRKEYPVGYIVDLLVLPDHLNVANELVKDGVNYFDQENVNIILVHILKNSLFEPILQKIGFVDYKSKAYLNYNPEYKNIAIDELKKSDIKTKHFVMGDTDWI
jgi:hypothetical protein